MLSVNVSSEWIYASNARFCVYTDNKPLSYFTDHLMSLSSTPDILSLVVMADQDAGCLLFER